MSESRHVTEELPVHPEELKVASTGDTPPPCVFIDTPTGALGTGSTLDTLSDFRSESFGLVVELKVPER